MKVSVENGPIAPGDRIVASSTPGVGMRATQAGMSVGIAAESFDGRSGDDPATILVFVNLAPTAAAPRVRGQSSYGEPVARGQARLRNGEAVITLSESLVRLARAGRATVQLTPIGGWSPLYVAEPGHNGVLLVRTAGGDQAQAFFWELRGTDLESPSIAHDTGKGGR
jgi:hypothetical protein